MRPSGPPTSYFPGQGGPFPGPRSPRPYTLIWNRFVACQMKPAVFDQTTALIDANDCRLRATGSIMRFPGFMALYVESIDNHQDPLPKRMIPGIG